MRLGPQMERWSTERLPDGNTVEVQKLVFTETKGGFASRQDARTTDPAALSSKHRRNSNRALGFSRAGMGAAALGQSVRQWFKKRCREAGLEDLSAHGLRKLGAQRCAETGSTEHQLMALVGWTSPQQASVYTKKASRAKIEAQAAALLQEQRSNKSVPLLPAVLSGGTARPKKA